MQCKLDELIAFCRVCDRLVFLDIGADRYFGLSAAAEAKFLAHQEMQQPNPASNSFSVSMASGRNVCFLQCDRPAAAELSSLEDAPGRAFGIRCAELLARHVLARIELRRGGFAASLEHIRRRKENQPVRNNSPVLHREVEAVRHCRAVLDLREKCLVHSIAVMHAMIGAGALPDLVLGIRLFPFEAHAWVEWQGSVVNDHADVVRAFTPILVI